MSNKNNRNKFLKDAFYTGLYFLTVFVLTALVLKYVGQRSVVEGNSMNNTLFNGESLWVNKFTYRFNDPERFDIVVFPYRYQENTYFIKRIIGLPGETVRIDEEGNIYINGEILEEHYGREAIRPENRGRAYEEIVLGENEYFVMGDNRNDSLDSRFEQVGNLRKEDFVGKAVFRLFPLSSFGGIY
ncbi:MAG: signal peptidase I [Lachnospiraceae bacterium]|nr:signal peptidase I [Lachnospiraceae bacterium]